MVGNLGGNSLKKDENSGSWDINPQLAIPFFQIKVLSRFQYSL